eukprot:m.221485 g.221485  ORF g.221485 m.221485 type:complete len:1613 (-) comp17250_c0_seq2:36-4874(-)
MAAAKSQTSTEKLTRHPYLKSTTQDVSAEYIDLWHDKRRDRSRYRTLLQEATALRKNTKPAMLSSEHEASLLSMDLAAELPQDKRVVKIFTSSTFTDTAHERNALMLDVYTYLREFCQCLELGFEVVDMRWGVRELASNEHRSAELCEQQVLRCLQASASVAFVTLIGDKYGWRPFPRHIPCEEFASIQAHLARNNASGAGQKLLTTWFALDNNAVPAEYVVRPVNHVYPNINSHEPRRRSLAEQCWRRDAEQLTATLRQGAHGLEDHQRWRYYRSITEREIELGALDNQDRVNQCIAFMRHIPILEAMQDGAQIRYKYLDEERDDFKHARALKDKLAEALPEANVHTVKLPWVHGIGCDPQENAEYLRELCDSFCDQCANMIMEQYKPKFLDELLEDVIQHLTFAQKKLATKGFSRQPERDAAAQYLSSDSTCAQVLHGQSGFGKSWLMTHIVPHIAQDYQRTQPSAILALRFLGITSLAADARGLLYSLCVQILRACKQSTAAVPEDFESLAQYLRTDVLPLATEDRPIVLILDAIDQLADTHNALHDVFWLPLTNLPPHCHVVVSCLPIVDGNHLLDRLLAVGTESSPLNMIAVSSLQDADPGALIQRLLQARDPARQLTAEQLSAIVGQLETNPSPLFLQLSLDQAEQWYSFTHSSVVEQYRQMRGVAGLIAMLFTALEERHGRQLVQTSLGLITLARHGLASPEIEDILSGDDILLNDVFVHWTPPLRVLPPSIWLRLRADLGDYLIERGSGEHKVLTWFHRQFREVATKRYLSDKREERAKSLGSYFTGQLAERYPLRNMSSQPLSFDEDNDWVKVSLPGSKPNLIPNLNLRKLIELPTALVVGELWTCLSESLCELEFLEAKLSIAPYDLMQDFATAVVAVEARCCDEDTILQLRAFYHLIQREFVVVLTRPHLLLQQCINNPLPLADAALPIAQVAAKYLPISRRGVARQCNTLPQSGPPELATLRVHTEWVTGLVVLSKNRLLTVSRDARAKMWSLSSCSHKTTYLGHNGVINGVAVEVVPGLGPCAATACADGRVRLFNLDTGSCHWSCSLTRSSDDSAASANCICFAQQSDETLTIVVGLDDGRLVGLSTCDGHELWQLQAHVHHDDIKLELQPMMHLRPGVCQVLALVDVCITVGYDTKVCLWSNVTHELVYSWQHESEACCVAASTTKTQMIASGDFKGIVLVYSLAMNDGEPMPLATLKHKVAVTAVSFSPNGRLLAAGLLGANGVQLWNAVTLKKLHLVRGHSYTIMGLQFSHDSQRLAVGYSDSVKYWDVSNALEEHDDVSNTFSHATCVGDAAWASNDQLVATSSTDIVKLWQWDVKSQQLQLFQTLDHPGNVYSVSFSKTSQLLLSTCWHSDRTQSTFRLWHASIPTEQYTLQHEGSGHTNAIVGGAIAPDERTFLTASMDETIVLWHMEGQPTRHLTLKGHTMGVRSVSYSPAGDRCLSVSEDGTGWVWDLFGSNAGACVCILKGHAAWVRDGHWGVDNRCYTVGKDRSLRVWNSTTGDCEVVSSLHSHIVWRVSMSGDGTRVVTSSEDGTAVVYDTATMEEKFCFAPRIALRSCALSHSGKHAIFGAVDGTLFLVHFTPPRPKLQRRDALES